MQNSENCLITVAGNEKRCLAGTREGFLECVAQLTGSRTRKLVLLGWAVTGKSTIANGVASRFDSKYLTLLFGGRRVPEKILTS
jgi:hypothetical protein